MTEPDRRVDAEKRDRIDDIEEANQEHRLRVDRSIRWIWRTAVILAIGNTLALVGYGLLADQNGNRIDDNKQTISDIQQSRRDSVLISCREQNSRHDNTVKTLDGLISSSPPERKTQARQSRAFTVLLIDALVPKRNCQQRVRQLVEVPHER